MCLGIAGLLTACTPDGKQQSNSQSGEFKYLVDEFADLKIMRYQVPEWENLSLQQKEYLYYLGEAAKCGRDIISDQYFKYNLTVRKTIEVIGTPLITRTLSFMRNVCSLATASITTMLRISLSRKSQQIILLNL